MNTRSWRWSGLFLGTLALLTLALPSMGSQAQRIRIAAPTEAYVNLSELHFAATRTGAAVLFEEEANPEPHRGPDERATVGARLRPAVRWNAERGRREAGDQLTLVGSIGAVANTAAPRIRLPGANVQTKSVQWDGGLICCEPRVTVSGSTCCSYTYPDQANGGDVTYYQPLKVFGNETEARKFVGTVRASMPLFLPYHDKNVTAGHGWIYNSGTFHGAIDYSSDANAAGTDPAFRVRAIGDGKVVSVFWDNWSGNIVIVEHTAANGDRYRSAYMHLRNGFDHDLEKARAIEVAEKDKKKSDGKPTNWQKYSLYAHKSNPSQQQWGTNSQKIAVKTGDTVTAGQFLGWSGNTGAGGAGNGLKDDGTPNNTHRANNHLHLMVTVPHPTTGNKNWIQVDPYGVYGQVKSDAGECYQLGEDTAYARLFAPFYPSFHNVPVDVLTKYWNYYTGMGMALQTISLHRKGNQVLASGSFQRGLPTQWYARLYMTAADYQKWFDTYSGQGFRPRQIAVTSDSAGNPRFSVIWSKRGSESYAAYHNLTDAQWKARWEEHVVKGKMRVEDRSGYDVGGSQRHAAIFVSGGGVSFAEWHNLTGAQFQQKFDDLHKQGLRLVSFDAAELKSGTYFGGVWQQAPGAWVAHYGLTPAQYQAKFLELSGQGYRLHKIQGYANSDRFAAIFRRT